jgi:2-(1,2-epoxy-1,2-dihydrophenyl)acetyl-CoA isomerase
MSSSSYEAVHRTPRARGAPGDEPSGALNTFNGALRREMLDRGQRPERDGCTRVVVLAGEGRAFCAGADLAEGVGSGAAGGVATEHMLKSEYKPASWGLPSHRSCGSPRYSGAAAGIGSAFMLACDLMVMAEEGLPVPGLCRDRPDPGWRRDLAAAARPGSQARLGDHHRRRAGLYAPRCLELGLCNRVVAAQELTAQTLAWAAQLANKAPLAVQYSKRALAMADGVALRAR